MTGITVTLLSKQQTGTDAFNRPTYSEISIPVENVLVAPVSEQEVLDTLNLTGRRAEYQLAIPSQISLLRAAEINEAAKAAMDTLPERPEVFRSALNSDYNYTDTETKTYRYQAVYDITF